jgi:transcriptional regulator with XRE-family HTH domain
MFKLYLREWRKARGLTQADLAEMIGSHHITISRIETGTRMWNGAFLFAVAVALDCHPADLFAHPPQRESLPHDEKVS